MIVFRECCGDSAHLIRVDEQRHTMCVTCLGMVCAGCTALSQLTRCKACHCLYKPKRTLKCLDHNCPCTWETLIQCSNCQTQVKLKDTKKKRHPRSRSRSNSSSGEGSAQKRHIKRLGVITPKKPRESLLAKYVVRGKGVVSVDVKET